MARFQQKFQESNRERTTMISHPFHHVLEPKIIIRLFFAVLVLHLHGAEAARTRCKTTKDCVDPENVQFCDENFSACMPCDSFCTGAVDTIPICMEKCPIRYTAVYGRYKQPEAPKVDVVPQDDPTPPKEPAPVPQNKKETGGNHSANQAMIVLGCFAFVVVTVVASVVGYLRWKKQTSETGHGDPEKATDKFMDGKKDRDEDNGEGQPDNNEGKPGNNEEKPENNEEKIENNEEKPENNEEKPEITETKNEVAGQADHKLCSTDALVFNSAANLNFAGLPTINMDKVDECTVFKDTTAGTRLQSMGSQPPMPQS